ncbi:hypothetical protein BDN70DRAFT_901412 [Pholiota conissans]|uniref:Tet-like 2OG-Fe(II) oxygenase domain-containing protein n=1 Tax=Pholiota conissans TaxID=109636 RepID=A0A9P6CLN0_9AGAR|nr:hypothetical protein BDN70DRAFT_901412 [Pholiota conissans]
MDANFQELDGNVKIAIFTSNRPPEVHTEFMSYLADSNTRRPGKRAKLDNLNLDIEGRCHRSPSEAPKLAEHLPEANTDSSGAHRYSKTGSRKRRAGGKYAKKKQIKQQKAKEEEERKSAAEKEKISTAERHFSLGYGQGMEANQKVKQTYMEKVLHEIYGSSVRLVSLEHRPKFLNALSTEEHETKIPLSSDCPMFEELDMHWIESSTPCLVIGWDPDAGDERNGEIIFMVRISPIDSLSIAQGHDIPLAINTIMEWTMAVYPINNNGSQKAKHISNTSMIQIPEPELPIKVHTVSTDLHHTSFAAGFHGSMETGKVLVVYAPKRTQVSLEKYAQTVSKLPQVQRTFTYGLASLNFKAFSKLSDASHCFYTPGFADIEFDGTNLPKAPFANSLTITRDDFANFLHHDNDHDGSVSYGLWWAAKSSPTGYVFNPNEVDHDAISGGEFLFGEYGVGVRFKGCKGVVEILWHGKHNAHCTLRSKSPTGITRFGTSIQLTQAGHLAMGRVWERGGVSTLIASYRDRLSAIR